MVTCPNCGKPVIGRARVCGYCGESIVRDYFSRKEEDSSSYPSSGAGTLVATILGVLGALLVLVGLALSIVHLFSENDNLQTPSLGWWIQTLLFALLPSIHLMQQALLHGIRFSIAFDAWWLFISCCGLGFLLQFWLELGAAAFHGSTAVAFLAMGGCVVVAVSCVTGILTWRADPPQRRA